MIPRTQTARTTSGLGPWRPQWRSPSTFPWTMRSQLLRLLQVKRDVEYRFLSAGRSPGWQDQRNLKSIYRTFNADADGSARRARSRA
jgi:hypothetical protein